MNGSGSERAAERPLMMRLLTCPTFTVWREKTNTDRTLHAGPQDTGDTRETPAIDVCHGLLSDGASLCVYDPQVSKDQIYRCASSHLPVHLLFRQLLPAGVNILRRRCTPHLGACMPNEQVDCLRAVTSVFVS